jgi:hypothetical protein
MWVTNKEVLKQIVELGSLVQRKSALVEEALVQQYKKLQELESAVKGLSFRLSMAERMTVKVLQQKEEVVMGRVVNVFTYQVNLAAVPEGNDAVKQHLTCDGLFQDASNPSVEMTYEFGKEPQVIQIKAVEEELVSLALSYEDKNGNKQIPRVTEFVCVDKVAPDVPIDALQVQQLPIQETVELEDEDPVSEEEEAEDPEE